MAPKLIIKINNKSTKVIGVFSKKKTNIVVNTGTKDCKNPVIASPTNFTDLK
jgi:hypothetical protein